MTDTKQAWPEEQYDGDLTRYDEYGRCWGKRKVVWLLRCPVQRRYRAREGEGGRESGKERQVTKGAAREEQKSRRLRGYRHANTAEFLVTCVELPLGMATKKQRAW